MASCNYNLRNSNRGKKSVATNKGKKRNADIFEEEEDSSDSEYTPSIESSSDSDDEDSGDSSSENEFESNEESEAEVDLLQNARQWNRIDMDNIPPPPPRFSFTATPKITIAIDQQETPLFFFELFFDEHLFEMITNETNKFAAQHISKVQLKRKSRSHQWQATYSNEMKVFIAILMLQGVVRKPRQEWYWSKRGILHTPIFSKVMGRDRFFLLMKYLHFADNETYNPSTHPYPKLWKLYHVVEYLQNKFITLLIPEKEVSIDESLMMFKGRLAWRQYIPLKRARFGVNFFVLCEAKSGYIWDFLIYTGTGTPYNTKYKDFPISARVVLHLMDRLLGQGYCVTVDNFYMSPDLADFLVTNKTDIYGTVRKNRTSLPPDFAKLKLEKGEVAAFQRGKVMALKWQDKKTVNLLSTIHNASSKIVKNKKGVDVLKPQVVCDYNLTMGGVDKSDQELSFYPCTRKQQKKYFKKIFRHLIDQSLWNAFVLFEKNSPPKGMQFLEFRLTVIEEILEKYSNPTMISPKGRPSQIDNPLRLTARHFATHIPANPVKKEPRRECKVCCSKKDVNGKRIRKETRIWCKDCGVGLCLEPCFYLYHTAKYY